MKGLSLFSNVGIAETNLAKIGFEIVVANELLQERAKFYRHLYPNCEMVCGDIADKSIYREVIGKAKDKKIEFVLATPPCQGMSCAGKKDPDDPRNKLIYYAVAAIKDLQPKYVLIENVPMQQHSHILYNNEKIKIPEFVYSELGHLYNINKSRIVNAKDYGVPQSRIRYIYLMVRKDIDYKWEFPVPTCDVMSVKDAIGDLPSLDPLLREKNEQWRFPEYEKKRLEGLRVSKWHYPPTHCWRQVEWMLHTPSGESAFKNTEHYPKTKGRMIKGAPRTYMRMSWEKPATTIMQNNGVISTFSTVHPGREIVHNVDDDKRIYSDARVLSIYELMILTSLPLNWNIPNWASESLIRNVIGEGVPPKLIEAAFVELKRRL